MKFTATFGSIGRIFACAFATKRGWTILTIYGLPLPTNVSALTLVVSQVFQYLHKYALLTPVLETAVNDTG
jgi:hypothetical protein